MKVCKTCNKELPLSCFGKHGISKDGLMSSCSDCRAKRTYHLDNNLERAGEIWKEIEGVPDAYVSNYGRVKSQTPKYGWKILKPQVYRRYKHRAPRLRVMIDRRKQGGKAYYVFLAKVVAQAFLPEVKDSSAKVLFRDGDPFNCSAFNLAWDKGFDSYADHMTLEHYSKMTSDLGVAAYKHLLKNPKPLERVLQQLEVTFMRRVGARFKLSDLEASEAYWEVVQRYLQKLPTGAFREYNEQEKILYVLVRECAKYKAIKKYKYMSDTNYSKDGEEYSFLDTVATSDLEGGNDMWDKVYGGF